MSDNADVAWAAGIFEGEGSVYLNTNRHGGQSPCLDVSNSDMEIIERFHAIVELGTVTHRTWKSLSTHKPLHRWRAAGLDAWVVFEMLKPWLTKRRLERGAEVFQHLSTSYAERRDISAYAAQLQGRWTL